MRRLLIATLLVLAANAALAENVALLDLQSRLGAIHSLQGNFAQTLLSDQAVMLEQSSGEFALLQPGYFAWHIQLPDEQLLLAAGGTLWHYDVELQTATRRPMPDNSQSPLAVLGGDVAQLDADYVVEAIAPQVFRLLPIMERGDFSELVLHFNAGLPQKMVLLDQLGRSTVIDFSELQLNPVLLPSRFEFVPPAGVDVYDND